MASVLQDQWNVNARRWCYRRERREVVESAMQASQSKSLIFRLYSACENTFQNEFILKLL